ncbi:MAG: hypothetical protein V1495_09765 [Pseudomonadota bacterium]
MAGGSPEAIEDRKLAGEEGNHFRERCLWAKWELLSGLVRASEWAKKAWKKSSGSADAAASRLYLRKMKSYASTAHGGTK